MWGKGLRKDSHMQPDDEKPDNEGADGAEPSAVVRNLGMIKAAAIIMGVLIILLTAVLIGTVASRLAKVSAPPETLSLTIPDGMSIRSASADEGGFVVIVDGPGGSEIWRLSPEGARKQTIRIVTE